MAKYRDFFLAFLSFKTFFFKYFFYFLFFFGIKLPVLWNIYIFVEINVLSIKTWSLIPNFPLVTLRINYQVQQNGGIFSYYLKFVLHTNVNPIDP